MRGHELFFPAARRSAQFIHKLYLLTHRLPKRLGSIGLDPLAVNLGLAGAVSVQPAANLAVNPVTRKNSRHNLAQGPVSRHRLQIADIGLRNRPLWYPIQLLARQSETLAETCMKTALHFDGAKRVTGEQCQ